MATCKWNTVCPPPYCQVGSVQLLWSLGDISIANSVYRPAPMMFKLEITNLQVVTKMYKYFFELVRGCHKRNKTWNQKSGTPVDSENQFR